MASEPPTALEVIEQADVTPETRAELVKTLDKFRGKVSDELLAAFATLFIRAHRGEITDEQIGLLEAWAER